MDQATLFSSYRRYKADTNLVAEWLLAIAKEHGYNSSKHLQGSVPTSSGSRLKGKARKAAKDAMGANADYKPSQVYRIKVQDFVSFAQYIAGLKKPRVKTPEDIKRAIQAAIRLRKNASAWCTVYQTAPSSLTALDGHDYFISILEEVQHVLLPDNMQAPGSSHAESATNAPAPSSANLFELLTLEQTVDAPENETTVPRAPVRPNIYVELDNPVVPKGICV